MTMAANS